MLGQTCSCLPVKSQAVVLEPNAIMIIWDFQHIKDFSTAVDLLEV